MPFNFPHKKIYVNVLSHSSLDYDLNGILIFVSLQLKVSSPKYGGLVSTLVNDA